MEITRSYAKQLRRELTKEERRLWYLLRSRRFENYKFRRQHPVGNYILDFACCAARLTLWLNRKGWYVIRFWNNELWDNEEVVLEKILETLQMLQPSPRPSP